MPFSSAFVPEFFCNDIGTIELAAPGIIRFTCIQDMGDTALIVPKVRILFPIFVIPSAVARTTAFVACHLIRGAGGSANAVIH